MKIVCDACQAKYSISDDKVQGKVFKIRCKKCSNIIVVRGGAGASEPAPAPVVEKDTRVYDYGYDGGGDQAPAGDEAVWHVVINQDQVGPMTAADVQRRFSSGEIDAETYIWREGFADWLPMTQVDQFAALATGSSAPAGGGGGAVASMFSNTSTGLGDEAGTMRSDPGDLFAAASSSARHADDDGGDLFGSKPAAPARVSAGDAAAAKMRGERNENSVLFSLNNLAQLASDRPAPAPSAPSSSSGAGHATGSAGVEGSGLIDIRSMANAYLGGGGGAKPATSSAIGSIDDLPVFGGGGFSEPAVIVPTSARSGGNSKLMYALIGSVGLLAVAAVILVIVMIGGKDKPAQVASNGTGSDDKAGKDPDTKPDPTDTMKGSDPKPDTGPGSAAEVKPDTKTDPTPDTKTDPKPDTKTDPKPAIAKTDPKPKQPVIKRDPKPAIAKTDPKPPVEKPDAGGGSCDEVSCVLSNYDGACCQKFRKGGSKPASGGTQIGEKPKSDLPESLDRAMISDGVGKVKAKVMACGDKSPAKGQVKVSVKVNPDGSVASVTVKSSPDPGLGSCVATAMQRASFKKTASGGSFGYPFVF
jgi:TonB family protein